MARQTTQLNATQVSQAKPKDKEYNLADGQGLMLRIKPTGTKLWLFNYYHPHTKKRQNISLGSFPTISLAEARKRRQENQGILANNIDPKSHRDEAIQIQQEAANHTFEMVALKWLSVHKTNIAEGTARNIQKSLEKDVFPHIGKIPLDQLTAPKALQVIKLITERNSLEIARKVARRLNNVMTYAVNAGIVHHNPLSGIKQLIPSSKVVNRPTLPPDELPDLMKALNFASIKLVTRCLIEWQLHCMVRPGEAAEAEWSEIDFERKLWVIPANRMKMDREHHVPLTEQAISILELVRPISGHRRYVFPSHNDPKLPANRQSANMAIKRMGFKGRLVAHGLRSLASTTLNEQGFDADVIEVALAHGDKDQIRAAYNRATYLEKRRIMMQWWSNHIEQAATGNMSLANAKQTLRIVNS
jgi:integrase